MVPHRIFMLTFLFSSTIIALPLNINLGAFSPAFVVGDGEISLGDAEDAGNLMETLASGASDAAAQTPPEALAAANIDPDTLTADADGDGIPDAEDTTATNGQEARVIIEGLNPDERQNAPNLVKIKRDVPEPALDPARTERRQRLKRDIEGFRAALQFAKEAMRAQPKVEIGTGAEGSGVGVIVNAGADVAADSAANGAEPPVAKRDLQDESPLEKQGITLVAIAEI